MTLIDELRSSYQKARNAEKDAFDQVVEHVVQRVRQAAADGEVKLEVEDYELTGVYEAQGFEDRALPSRVVDALRAKGLTADTGSRPTGPNESTSYVEVSGWAS